MENRNNKGRFIKGYKPSEETIRKRIESRKGYKHSEETKRKMSENNAYYWLGKKKPMLEETKKKIGEANIISHKGIKYPNRKKPFPFTEAHRRKIGRKGKDNAGWIDGRTPENKKIRHSIEYKLWRKAVFERDNYTCIWCGAKSGNGKAIYLEADHIKPFSLYPELRFAIDNGRTLCKNCHKTTDTFAGRTMGNPAAPNGGAVSMPAQLNTAQN